MQPDFVFLSTLDNDIVKISNISEEIHLPESFYSKFLLLIMSGHTHYFSSSM